MDEAAERLALYQVMVDTITANEGRRQQVFGVFMTLVAAGLTALGSIESLDPAWMAVAGLIASVVTTASIDYFRRLATAKFAVVAELEAEMSYQPFGREYEILLRSRRWHISLTWLESVIPMVVAVGCLGYLLGRLVGVWA